MTPSRHTNYLRHLHIQLDRHPHLRALLAEYPRETLILTTLSLDPVRDDLAALYCPTGQGDPYDPICMLRSWLLMTLLHVTSPDAWATRLRREAVLAVLAGFAPQHTPCATAHRDFLNRLADGPYESRSRQHTTLSQALTGRHERRLDDATEARNKEAGPHNTQSQALVDKLLQHADDPREPNALHTRLEDLFVELGLKPTLNAGLLDQLDALIASGDGTTLATAASAEGRQTCDCPPNSPDCDHPRRYTSATAQWCKDPHHNAYVFGDRSYTISVHQNGHDFPLLTILPGGNESDFTLAPKALDDLLKMFREHDLPLGLAIFIGDGQHDASAIYLYLREKGIMPIIPLRDWGTHDQTKQPTANPATHPSKNPAEHPSKNPTHPSTETPAETPTATTTNTTTNRRPPIHPHLEMYPHLSFDPDGTPLCPGGCRMRHYQYVNAKYAHYFTCPVKRKNRHRDWIFHTEECPRHQDCCSDPNKKMGYTLYIKSTADPRLLPPIPRNSKRFKTLYHERTSTERSNSVEDSYHLDRCHRNAVYGLIRLTFVNICKHAVIRSLEQRNTHSNAELVHDALTRLARTP